MKKRMLKYWYDPDWDRLFLADVSEIGIDRSYQRGEYEAGYAITEKQGMGFIVDIDAGGRCIGFEFFDSGELLLPHLLPDEFEETDLTTDLVVEYCLMTDRLTITNGKPSDYREGVNCDWITLHESDTDSIEPWRVGEIVGFTLGRVSEYILPHLLQYAPVDPGKQERMRRFRKSGVAR